MPWYRKLLCELSSTYSPSPSSWLLCAFKKSWLQGLKNINFFLSLLFVRLNTS